MILVTFCYHDQLHYHHCHPHHHHHPHPHHEVLREQSSIIIPPWSVFTTTTPTEAKFIIYSDVFLIFFQAETTTTHTPVA